MYPSDAEKQKNLQEFLKKKENRLRYGTTSYKAFNQGATTQRLSPPCVVTNRSSSRSVVNERPKTKLSTKKMVIAKKESDLVNPDIVQSNELEIEQETTEEFDNTVAICNLPEKDNYQVALETLRSVLDKKVKMRENERLYSITEQSEMTQSLALEKNAQTLTETQAKDPTLWAKVSQYTKTVIISAVLVVASIAMATFDGDTWEWLLDAVSTVEYIDFFSEND
ncbi:Hypothetical predicted protein [Cloeon dipterum]|uniref:Uncharacterized protein n=1 Tax=Cloeon dipterum TaxID=197152 RepID=A0A8S1DAE4_9INSE|nr:Hypothetical predicted protein [Cloeon dipterum]